MQISVDQEMKMYINQSHATLMEKLIILSHICNKNIIIISKNQKWDGKR